MYRYQTGGCSRSTCPHYRTSCDQAVCIRMPSGYEACPANADRYSADEREFYIRPAEKSSMLSSFFKLILLAAAVLLIIKWLGGNASFAEAADKMEHYAAEINYHCEETIPAVRHKTPVNYTPVVDSYLDNYLDN